MEIEKRKLTKEEAEIISDEIKNTDNIVGYLPSELVDFGDFLVVKDGDIFIGVLLYKEYINFVDFKIFFIRKAFRCKGYGKLLFANFLKEVNNSKKMIYTVTRNPIVAILVKEVGFMEVNFFQLPLGIILHQVKMLFSRYRIKEFYRKGLLNPKKEKYSYWIRN